MTLNELAAELLKYLVAFRTKVALKVPQIAAVVAADLEAIVITMDGDAKNDPSVRACYKGMRRTIVIAADGIVCSSDWDAALQYRTEHLLERKLYPAKGGPSPASDQQMAGEQFYQGLSRLPLDATEEREFYMTALAIGFKGDLASQPGERLKHRQDLYAKLCQDRKDLPKKLTEDVTPAAYEHLDDRDCTVPPLARWSRYAIVLAGVVVFLLIVTHVVYAIQKHSIHNVVEALP
ncbi:MAG: DotU family type IV/VI secretion system protein [bacterium]|nr:DotU family type IV/VI secretion system protein [bacterium]